MKALKIMNAEASHHYTKLLSKNEKSSHDLNKMGIDDLDKELKCEYEQRNGKIILFPNFFKFHF